MKSWKKGVGGRCGLAAAAALGVSMFAGGASAFIAHETVDFRVDPATIDGNNDGFITAGEFNPVGTDGTVFTMTPIDNFVGGPRFLLSPDRGIQFGGGGGSSIEFDFSPSNDIELLGYVIPDTIFVLGNPAFEILDSSDTVISAANDAAPDGTYAFDQSPIALTGGETYTVLVPFANTGAAVQSFFPQWHYTPEPGALALLGLGGVALLARRRA